MSVLNQDAGELLLRGYAWWTRELSSLVPGKVKDSWREDKPDAVVVVENGRIQLSSARWSGPGTPTAGSEDAGDACWNRIAQLAKSRRPAQVHVLVPYAACLVRNLDVPAAARTNAASILALDLERAMPFDLADVYTAHVIDPIKPSPGMVRLSQLIVKRDKVDPIVARIVAAGAKVTRIGCLSPDGTRPLDLNFLANLSAGISGQRSASTPLRTLSVMTAALALSAIWISVDRHETAVADLDGQLAAARSRIASVDQTRTQASTRMADVTAISQVKASRIDTVRVVEELTRILPDSAWLTELSIKDGAVDLSGFAKQAAALVPVLEQSSLFADVALTAPVTLDATRNQERFSFRLRLRETRPAEPDTPVPSEGALP